MIKKFFKKQKLNLYKIISIFLLTTFILLLKEKISLEKVYSQSTEPFINNTIVNNFDFLGQGILSYDYDYIGDFDNDGVPDLVYSFLYPSCWGGARIVLMNRNGSVKTWLPILDMSGFCHPYDGGHPSVANIGDLNGDGVNDIAIGQMGNGSVTIIYLSRNRQPNGLYSIGTFVINGYTPNGPSQIIGQGRHGYGRSVAGIGDVDGDGVPDLAVGAYSLSFGAYYNGCLLYTSPSPRDS